MQRMVFALYELIWDAGKIVDQQPHQKFWFWIVRTLSIYIVFHIPTIVSYVYIHNIYACSYSICKWSISIVWKCKQFHKLSLNYHLKQIWFLHLIQIKFIWCICCNKCEFKIRIWFRIRFQIYVLIALWWS